MSAPSRYLAARFVATYLSALAAADLVLMLVVVGVHAYYPSAVPTGELAPMAYVLAGSSGAALLSVLLYVLLAYPAQRRTVLLLALIVLGILGAHLYTVNNPPVSLTDSLSAKVGGEAYDSHVTVFSSVNGTNLNVVVTDSGTDAIGPISLSLGDQALPGSGFTKQPTLIKALQPGNEDKGTWAFSSKPSGTLTLTYADMTCYATDKQVDGCVMDEVYYVPAAQTLLSGERCAPYADNCNMEHPFLSKAFIAAGIVIFGNDTFGWRIFNILLGTFSIPLIFGICWVVTKNQRLSIYAAFLLAFETLFFVHSSIAVIDVGAIFFGLLGFLVYFANVRWWKFDPISLAGVAMGLAALVKETALFFFLVLFLYHLFFAEGSAKRVGLSAVELSAVTFVVFAVGLQIYDGAFGSGTATNFIGQLDFILKYGGSLVVTPSVQACLFHFKPSDSCGWIDPVLKSPITPLNWVTYYSPVAYLVTDVTVRPAGAAAYTFVTAGYYGVTNQFEVWLLYGWGAYTGYLWWKTRGRFAPEAEAEAREFRLARLALVWVLLLLLGYGVLFLYGRITYPYYFISAVPALSIGAAYFLTRSWFPRPIAYIFLAGVFLWFFLFYPDKAFLPTQLRVFLGH